MPARSLTLSITLVLMTLSGCKGDPETKTDAPPDLGPKAKAANDEVPEALKATITFEVQELDDGNILALVPKGWAPGFMPGSFKPAGDEFSRVSYTIGSNCDGMCTKKNWAEIVDKVEFHDSVPSNLTLETDELLEGTGGRIRVFTSNDEVFVRAAWWLPESNRYFSCKADLQGPTMAAKQAFVSACKATHVLDWN